MLKKFPSEEINGTKNVFFFVLAPAPTYHIIIFKLRFFYELMQMVHLSKNVSAIFHF